MEPALFGDSLEEKHIYRKLDRGRTEGRRSRARQVGQPRKTALLVMGAPAKDAGHWRAKPRADLLGRYARALRQAIIRRCAFAQPPLQRGLIRLGQNKLGNRSGHGRSALKYPTDVLPETSLLTSRINQTRH